MLKDEKEPTLLEEALFFSDQSEGEFVEKYFKALMTSFGVPYRAQETHSCDTLTRTLAHIYVHTHAQLHAHIQTHINSHIHTITHKHSHKF